MSIKRIAVLAPMGTLDHQPGVLRAVDGFSDAGYIVDVFTIRNEYYHCPQFHGESIRVHFMPIRFNRVREPRTLVTMLFSLWMLVVFRGRYEAVFAAGVRGLFAAYILHLLRATRVVNYQIELYVNGYGQIRFQRLFKFIERRAIQASWFSIDHDERRAQVLCEDAGLPRDRVVIVPNAPRGIAEERTTDFLHRRLGLDPGLRLVVSAGAIDPGFMAMEIVEGAQVLPEGWRCVLHSSSPRTRDDPFIQRLIGADVHGRVCFSLAPVASTEVDDLIGSARIGLCLYSLAARPDHSLVGLASGKLSAFLRCGVPVIVSDLPGLQEFVTSHCVGIPISSVSQLPEAVRRIEADYDGFRRRAVTCFSHHLSHDVHFRAVLDRIRQG